jgi:hypothetical protein
MGETEPIRNKMPRQKLPIIAVLILAMLVVLPGLAGFRLAQAAPPPAAPPMDTASAPGSVEIVPAPLTPAISLVPISMGCETATGLSALLIQDQPKVNLNQPASCFSLSLRPFHQTYALNPLVATAQPRENIVIDSRQYSLVSYNLSAVPDVPFLAPALVPVPALYRAIILNSLLAALVSLVFGYLLLMRSRPTLSVLCVRRC